VEEFLARFSGRTIGVDGLLALILAGSLALNVNLGVERARTPRISHDADTATLMKPGTQAPAFEGIDAKGARVSLTYNADMRDTMLYVFSPSCHWCERNFANIKAIVDARRDLRMVGVSLGNVQTDSHSNQIGFEAIVRPTAATIKAHGLRATPTTILVSHVRKAWPGAYTGTLGAEVSKVLVVSLPGLVEQVP
jgi:hypothetical protein